MTCKCGDESDMHQLGGKCMAEKISGCTIHQCKCKKYVEKIIDENHTKALEQKRIKNAADVEVVFTTGNCFNVLASKDEYDRTGKILMFAKGSVKYNGEIHGPFPHKDDHCSCPSFQNGVSLDEKIAFQCKHLIKARNQRFPFVDDMADLPAEEAKKILDAMSSGIKYTMDRINEEDAKDEIQYLRNKSLRDSIPPSPDDKWVAKTVTVGIDFGGKVTITDTPKGATEAMHNLVTDLADTLSKDDVS